MSPDEIASDAAPERPTPAEPTRREKLDEFLEPLYRDPSLRPLLITVGLCFVTFGAAGVFLAIFARSVFAMGSLALFLVMTVDVIQGDLRARRFGPLARILTVLWLASVAAAWLARGLGWF